MSCLTTRDTLPFCVFTFFFLFRERKHIIVALTSIVRLIFLCWVKPPFIVQGPILNGRGRRNHHFLCCFNMLKALQRSWLKHFAFLVKTPHHPPKGQHKSYNIHDSFPRVQHLSTSIYIYIYTMVTWSPWLNHINHG